MFSILPRESTLQTRSARPSGVRKNKLKSDRTKPPHASAADSSSDAPAAPPASDLFGSLEQAAEKPPERVSKKRLLEEALWKAFMERRDDDSRNALWVHYAPLVDYLAGQLKLKLPDCIDPDDLVSSGNIGLVDAIERFDPAKGVRFETYCVQRVRGAMLDYIRGIDWVPRLIRNKNHRFQRVVAQLTADLGRDPREEELAAHLKVSSSQLEKMRKELTVRTQVGLERSAEKNNDRDATRLDERHDPRVPVPTRDLELEEIRRLATTGLQPMERLVVEEYYFEGRSMKEIGDKVKRSESRICQVHTEVLRILSNRLKAYEGSCEV